MEWGQRGMLGSSAQVAGKMRKLSTSFVNAAETSIDWMFDWKVSALCFASEHTIQKEKKLLFWSLL